MQQVVLIHGGDVFENYEAFLNWLKHRDIDFSRHGLRQADWQSSMSERLGSEFQLIRPEMPDKRNAKYEAWKIWFEKFIPYMRDGIILVGSSLGGSFLAKYLSENNFPKQIKAVFLVAGAYGSSDQNLLDFSMPKDLSKLAQQAEKIILYHSKDDNIVPFDDVNKFKQAWPKAEVRVFEDRQHFNQAELPELIEDIKKL